LHGLAVHKRAEQQDVRPSQRRALHALRAPRPARPRCRSFWTRLRRDGVLVHERYSERNPGEITGYAVASPDSVDAVGKPVYCAVAGWPPT
jgi:hypothetical protein